MSTTKTWPGGGTAVSPTSYSIPAAGELNWAALSDFLNALGDGAQSTTFQKFAIRKATSSPVTVSATTDCVIVTDLTVPGAVTVNLPAGANKQVFIIADGKGDAATNNITINRNGTDTIAGATSVVLNANKEFIFLAFNSGDTDWKIIARGNGQTAFVNPMTTAGDLIIGGASGVAKRLAAGSSNTVLTSAGAADEVWKLLVDANIDAAAAITGSKIVSASGSVSGVVTTGSQTFAGTKTFDAIVCVGDLTVDTNTLYVDSANNRVGVGTTSFTSPTSGTNKFEVRGTTSPRAVLSDTATGNPGWELWSNSNAKSIWVWNESAVAVEIYNGNVSTGTPRIQMRSDASTRFNGGIALGTGSTISEYVEWTSVAYSSGNFTSSNVGAWTVDSGDQTVFKYKIVGRTMYLDIVLNNTSLSGVSNSLSIALPASKTAAVETRGHLAYVDANVAGNTIVDAFWDVQAAGTTIRLQRAGTSGTPWAVVTNQLTLYISAAFEIS